MPTMPGMPGRSPTLRAVYAFMTAHGFRAEAAVQVCESAMARVDTGHPRRPLLTSRCIAAS